jgi:cytochrome c-type biogenesis protein CcmF
MSLGLLVLPAGALLAWKRGDALGVLQRLWWAALGALILGIAAFALVRPQAALAGAGVALGAWVILGSLTEIAERIRLFKAPAAESGRRLIGLPRGAWGMTLAHIGLGVFILGAAVENAGKIEAAEVLRAGGRMPLGAYEVRLDRVAHVEGPNYVAERGYVRVLEGGRTICEGGPERRAFTAGGQTTSEVALCLRGLDDLYLVLGEQRLQPDGQPGWLVRAYVNPWARLLLAGPLLIALGGLVSLSDRRLRFALPKRRERPVAQAA